MPETIENQRIILRENAKKLTVAEALNAKSVRLDAKGYYRELSSQVLAKIITEIRCDPKNALSILFLLDDTLEARLLAQEFLRVIKKSLLEMNAFDPFFEIAIYYNISNQKNLNLREYTLEEQLLDQETALEIIQDPIKFQAKCAENKFEFLLGINSLEAERILKNKELIIQLIQSGYFHILDALIEKQSVMTRALVFKDWSESEMGVALLRAIKNKHLATCETLVAIPGVLDYAGSLANLLLLAVNCGNLSLVKLLIAKGFNVNLADSNGITPLHIAIQTGNAEIFFELTYAGANINAATKLGITPLYLAAEQGSDVMVSYLLENKADVNSPAYDGVSPLYIAVQQNQLMVVDILLNRSDIKVDAGRANGATPFLLAAFTQNLEMVKKLITHKANVNQAIDQETGLHFAVRKGNLALVQILLDGGANPNLLCHGLDPLTLMRTLGYNEEIKSRIKSAITDAIFTRRRDEEFKMQKIVNYEAKKILSYLKEINNIEKIKKAARHIKKLHDKYPNSQLANLNINQICDYLLSSGLIYLKKILHDMDIKKVFDHAPIEEQFLYEPQFKAIDWLLDPLRNFAKLPEHEVALSQGALGEIYSILKEYRFNEAPILRRGFWADEELAVPARNTNSVPYYPSVEDVVVPANR